MILARGFIFASFLFMPHTMVFAEKNENKDGVLLDKIYGVFNDQILTLSAAKKIQSELPSRAEVAPMIYSDNVKTVEDVREIFFRQNIIRDKLTLYGYEMTDSVIEERIQAIEKSQGISRDDLIEFLQSRNMTYESYFEMIKVSMEHSYFTSKIIGPLVSVSDQEIKNAFYEYFPDKKAFSHYYTIVDINLPNGIEKIYSESEIIEILKKYRSGGSIPEALKDIESFKIEDIDIDGLSSAISKALENTPPQQFSSIVKVNGMTKIFYVESRSSKPSSFFKQNKNSISQMITMNKAKNVERSWFESEMKQYYVRRF